MARQTRLCSLEGCEVKHNSLGYCSKHYQCLVRNGDPLLVKVVPGEKHDSSKTRLYAIWRGMSARCYNPNNKSYKNYGGRGIKMCDEWRKSFTKFRSDMGERPTPEYTLERIDNDGDYTPENCKWATWTEQSNNRRVTVRYKGKLRKEWASLLKVNYGTYISYCVRYSDREAVEHYKLVTNNIGGEEL